METARYPNFRQWCSRQRAPRLSATRVLANSTVSFVNSLLTGDCAVFGAGISSLGGNIESPASSCGFSQGTDQNSVEAVDLALGALGDNGGPTPTHLPASSSFANGSAFDTLCLLVGDQRGVVRVSDCESGAVERTGAHVETPIFLDGFLQGDTEAWSATVP